eukprot:Opistho-2@77411
MISLAPMRGRLLPTSISRVLSTTTANGVSATRTAFHPDGRSTMVGSNKQRTAAACVIGDEILTGKVADTNTHTLAKFCFAHGISLRRVEIVPDVEDDIVKAVRNLSQGHDLVFTSGGIGPTHDDITYAAIAKCFGRSLEYHAPTLELMERISAKPPNEAARRMALIPYPANVLQTEGFWVPLVVCENVYILPGVPFLFSKMLEGMSSHIGKGVSLARASLYTPLAETDFADALRRLQETFPSVAIGSYPRFLDKKVRGMLTFEGFDADKVAECAQAARLLVHGADSPDECVLPLKSSL